MIIGVDGNEANIEKRVGINVYAFDLLWSIWQAQKKASKKDSLIVYLKNRPRKDMPPATKTFRYQVIPGEGMWVLTKLMPYLWHSSQKPDVFFSPSHYAPFFTPMPKVCSIMDLGYLEFTAQFKKYDYWQLRVWSAISIFVSKAVIAISNSTKKDIVRRYPFAARKVFVTHLGYDREIFNTSLPKSDVERVAKKYSIVRKEYNLVKEYILYLGTLKPSKNIEGLISAFALIKDEFPEVKLVIAGKKGWLYGPIFEKVQELGLDGRVIFTDFVPDADKPALIAGARAFILPSFWEGFGLDVLSAMGAGVPVVVSEVGSLPEVAGEGGVFVDPNSVESIARGIKKVLRMPKLEYNKLSERARAQAQKFSWDKTARETLDILKNVSR